ncbi:MAG TPA: HAMP domain-containing sensor histidine kinase [Methylomirabilota bacterium]|nr:HAMP domain-containing sensor histidine kinase [Methylomirabilota bacterium]
MKARLPLYAKILLWFFLNVALLVAISYMVFRAQFRFGSELALSGRAGDRLQSITDLLRGELSRSQEGEWDQVLARFAEAYHVDFYLFREDGSQAAGPAITLPLAVAAQVQIRPPAPEGSDRPRPPFAEQGRRDRQRNDDRDRRGPAPGPGRERINPSALRPRFLERTEDPKQYWIGLRLRGERREGQRPTPPMVALLRSESIQMGGLVVDFKTWGWVGAGALVLSALFWAPFAFSMTRAVAQMTAATARIAEGDFNTKTPAARRDELGELAAAINKMAERLAGFVSGQKRFLGDIAHELCSPLARIQMAVGILEERGGQENAALIQDLREEVQEMSALVNELLSFSKASLGAHKPKLDPVSLQEIVSRAITREDIELPVQNTVPADVKALGNPDLLVRAVANVLRNSARHANGAGPVQISATEENGQIQLRIRDHGPGVPDSELPRLFDPFYRVDTSRARETGGVGLGLAIVKTCVEACDGAVTCQNARPGLEVVFTLRLATTTA